MSSNAIQVSENPPFNPSLCTSQVIIINKRFKLISRIGGGAFGELYLSYDNVLKTNVALKFETISNVKNTQLPYEYKLYKIFSGQIGIPNVYWLGKEGDFPGVASEKERELFLRICPDPNLILRSSLLR